MVSVTSALVFKMFHPYVWAEATDNANVNFVKYKGDFYVSTETNYMRQVDPQSLETKEKVRKYIKWMLLLINIQRGKRGRTGDDEDKVDDDAVCLRWTGVNTSLSTQLPLTHIMTVMDQHTTWETPMAEVVKPSFTLCCHILLLPNHTQYACTYGNTLSTLTTIM